MSKKTGIYVTLVLAFIVIFGKILLPPTVESTPSTATTPPGDVVSIPEGTRPSIKAIYVKGGFSDDLLQKQKDLLKTNQYFYTVVENKSALDKFIREYQLTAESGTFDTYTADFFTTKKLIAVFIEQSSSGVYFAVTDFVRTNSAWKIAVEQTVPAIMTMDLINRGFFIEVESGNLTKDDIQIEVTKRIMDPDAIDKSDLTTADLQLGNLKLHMSRTELDQALGAQPTHSQQEQNGIVERRFYTDVELTFTDGELSFISVTSPDYATVRGLKVGDTVDHLVELYGEPSQIQDDTYSFDLSGEYFLFHAKVADGIITTLQVNLAC